MFGPMALSNVPGWKSTPAASSAKTDAAKTAASPGDKAVAVPHSPQLEGLPLVDLAEVLRFDVTPGWIMHRWSRVSTGLGMLQLQGYRVPLVTGTSESDLAGSLTYYFNPMQQVEQITFSGTTGDVRRLVQFTSAHFGLGRRVVNDPGLFVYEVPESRGPARSVLKIRPARILTVNQTHERFDVDLVLARPQEQGD
jgi:hypothetical protein